MKRFILVFLTISGSALAGGGIGGVPPSVSNDLLELARFAYNPAALPKAYADHDDFRRASVRLGETGVETVDLTVDGEKIKVRKLRDSVVDEKVLKEILPSQ